uniref:Hydrolase n=1 Tax=uncultured bacterium A1Q1_fos_2067 TaxID=1256560 RepID=L7VY52_9BACT|nr:hydrolase [uncultured bacterium A1Q1_fos_2067]
MKRYALFDLDHTLLPHDTQALFCNFVLRRERWRTLLHLVFLPVAILRVFKLVPLEKAKCAFMAYLWRMPKTRLMQHARDFAETEVKSRVYPELIAEVERHRSEGRVLVLNTASPVIYPPDIARVLGFDHCVATPLVIEDPMPLIPRLSGPNNKNEQKIPNMERDVPGLANLTAEQRADCWSYSDSPADTPLLAFSGRQVLVHPGSTLRQRFPDAIVFTPPRPYASKVGDMLSVVRQVLGLYS